jgi:hypothetical protein
MAIGDAVALTLNGVRYKVVQGIEPQVNKGGKHASESQDYGDGSSEPYMQIQPAGITGLQVLVDKENEEAFQNAKGLDSMAVVLECLTRSYECTGYILGDVTISATKRTTSEFEIRVSDGGGVRES